MKNVLLVGKLTGQQYLFRDLDQADEVFFKPKDGFDFLFFIFSHRTRHEFCFERIFFIVSHN